MAGKNMIFSIARKFARNLGVDARRANFLTVPELRIVHFLKRLNVGLVLDVGANMGQFATALFDDGYSGRIISFEPLPDAHSRLVLAARKRPEWTVAPRLALGRAPGTASLYIAGNSVRSSLLAMADTHVVAVPESR